jgi:hypothetical protein
MVDKAPGDKMTDRVKIGKTHKVECNMLGLRLCITAHCVCKHFDTFDRPLISQCPLMLPTHAGVQ